MAWLLNNSVKEILLTVLGDIYATKKSCKCTASANIKFSHCYMERDKGVRKRSCLFNLINNKELSFTLRALYRMHLVVNTIVILNRSPHNYIVYYSRLI